MQLIMAEEPDLLLLGGDYVSESPRYLPETASVIGAYTRRLPFGALAVFGNHDYSNDAPRMERLLSAEGVHVLRNEATLLPDAGLWIAGIDDAILPPVALDVNTNASDSYLRRSTPCPVARPVPPAGPSAPGPADAGQPLLRSPAARPLIVRWIARCVRTSVCPLR